MRADLDLVLYWSSLALSAAAVVLFVWLMRERPNRKPEAGSRKPEAGSR